MKENDFEYVLPSIFSDDAIEKFFGQARQRAGGNFYIDVKDIKAAAKVKNLHTLVKHDVMPDECIHSYSECVECTKPVNFPVYAQIN